MDLSAKNASPAATSRDVDPESVISSDDEMAIDRNDDGCDNDEGDQSCLAEIGPPLDLTTKTWRGADL